MSNAICYIHEETCNLVRYYWDLFVIIGFG